MKCSSLFLKLVLAPSPGCGLGSAPAELLRVWHPMSDLHKRGKPTYAAEPRELSEGRREEGTRARPKQGQRLEPKVKNKTLYLACSCSGFQASVSTA